MRALLAMALAGSLPGNGTPASLGSIGIIVHSRRAHLGTGSATEGTALFDGDRLSTDENGKLGIKSETMLLQLEAQTSLTLTALPGEQGGASVALEAGTMVFSAARTTAVEVRADGAVIRPAADTPTIAHVRVVGPKELRVFARRGELEFSYDDEHEVITEGACYRIVLDPEEDDKAPNPDTGGSKNKPNHRHKSFWFVAIAAGAAAAALAPWHSSPSYESPHQP